jgi:predicted  nucleic acid-binding Zn-ribbon protein
MPHQCTNCGRTFADGSKEMLSGCPDCSGTKFQFRPEGFDTDGDGTGADAADSPADDGFDADGPGDAVSRTVGSAADTVRDLVGRSGGADTTARPRGVGAESTDLAEESAGETAGDDDIIVAESEPLEESDAQAKARSQLVEPDGMSDDSGPAADPASVATDSRAGPDVDSAGGPGETVRPVDGSPDRSVADAPDAERGDRPDLAELREELNEQFESIRVVEPGQYELNLMELYDREEYIIALQEDGRYSIQVPETWRNADG